MKRLGHTELCHGTKNMCSVANTVDWCVDGTMIRVLKEDVFTDQNNPPNPSSVNSRKKIQNYTEKEPLSAEFKKTLLFCWQLPLQIPVLNSGKHLLQFCLHYWRVPQIRVVPTTSTLGTCCQDSIRFLKIQPSSQISILVDKGMPERRVGHVCAHKRSCIWKPTARGSIPCPMQLKC